MSEWSYNGTGVTQLTFPINGSYDDDDSVSPDGTTVLFDRTDITSSHTQLFTVPLTGGTPTQLTHPAQGQVNYSVWSTDKSTIYFQLDTQPSAGVYYQQIASINVG